MKHVVTRPTITTMRRRLGAAYTRQPLLQPLALPLICGLITALLTFLFANGGGPLFVIGALGVVTCVVWAGYRGTGRLIAFATDYLNVPPASRH